MYKILSLFANVGIAELNLNPKKFKTVLYNELLPIRAKFYNHFHKKTEQIIGDITSSPIRKSIIERSEALGVDFIMATPPCQGFSIAGKRVKDDPRNLLILDAMEIIKKIKPKYVFIENVVQYFKDEITYKGMGITIPNVIKDVFKKDYVFSSQILNSKDFGVPQSRKRGFILLSRKDMPEWEFPKGNKKQISVMEAIGHLPSLEPLVKGMDSGDNKTDLKNHNIPTHNSRHIKAMSHTPSGKTAHNNKVHYPKKENGDKVKGFSTTYKRISWDSPAPTITMMNGSVSSQNNVHPGRKLESGKYSDPRVLSLREIFILSSIDPDWDYPKWASENLVRQVVGEGIPPKLVSAIFSKLK